MQSEERHELKQNDLQEFLANFGEFWKQWGNSILIVITIAVIAFAGYRIYTTRMQTRDENTWADLALTSSPASFAELGKQLPYPAARAVANLNGADLYLQEATDPAPAEAGAMPAEEKLSRAEQLYRAVLDEEVHEALHLNALLGLAEVTVARQQFDEATQQFEQITARAGEAYPVHAGIAEQRLADMERLRNPVPLAEDPEPTPQPSPDGPAPPLPPMIDEPADTGADAGTEDAAAPAANDEAASEPEATAPAEDAAAPAEQAP